MRQGQTRKERFEGRQSYCGRNPKAITAEVTKHVDFPFCYTIRDGDFNLLLSRAPEKKPDPRIKERGYTF